MWIVRKVTNLVLRQPFLPDKFICRPVCTNTPRVARKLPGSFACVSQMILWDQAIFSSCGNRVLPLPLNSFFGEVTLSELVHTNRRWRYTHNCPNLLLTELCILVQRSVLFLQHCDVWNRVRVFARSLSVEAGTHPHQVRILFCQFWFVVFVLVVVQQDDCTPRHRVTFLSFSWLFGCGKSGKNVSISEPGSTPTGVALSVGQGVVSEFLGLRMKPVLHLIPAHLAGASECGIFMENASAEFLHVSGRKKLWWSVAVEKPSLQLNVIILHLCRPLRSPLHGALNYSAPESILVYIWVLELVPL